ncbi:Basic-leucine zipper (bZIP) transcription factor family protein [Striga hermonthica]|uniref:Basic-leucine zipper (BZIP) transcription factor family protein n=1 Tax=Striga hermonthica TaxID=68872 RepID=A0A9N7NQ36_STRHE|nr:Basic-leucine zipper (bZIP) transcription factor family protein [Striga hermonthica]
MVDARFWDTAFASTLRLYSLDTSEQSSVKPDCDDLEERFALQDPNTQHSTNQMQPFSGVMRPAHHRRAHSEVNFRLPEDLDLASDPFDAPAGSFEEMGSEDDLFSTYMDMEKLAGRGSAIVDSVFDNDGGGTAEEAEKSGEGGGAVSRPRHRHSNSVDSSSLLFNESGIEAKKAMAPEKLSELWSVDPKRAKRILANRQSAARSKERKARYISELERKIQTLQTEATTLSAQLTLFQRDTSGLGNENTGLKLRLQAMEQQAQLRDALNEALKQEVERLRMATGEISSTKDTFSLLPTQQLSYNQSTFFPHQLNDYRNFSMQHFLSFPDPSHEDPLGRFQGFDIGSWAPHPVKSEGPFICASESSTAF